MRLIIGMVIALAGSALFAGIPFAQTLTPPATDSAPLWTATAPGRPTLLLLPTIHKLPADDPRIDDRLSQAASRAEALVLESPLSVGKKDLPMVLRYGLYGSRDNITNHVSTLTAEALARCARQSNENIVRFFQLKPWLAALAVDGARMAGRLPGQTKDGKPSPLRAGIDERLLKIAQRNMMPVIYLETIEQAMEMFDDMPADEQEAYLKNRCAGLTGPAPGELNLSELEQAWLDSDTARIEQISTTRDPHESQSVYDANQYIVHDGTKIFAAAIEGYGYFHGKGPILIAVGAAHFFGDDSLLERLKADGYTITAPPGVTRTACGQSSHS
jgi:uncharacterized protein YbaP (TraB family)